MKYAPAISLGLSVILAVVAFLVWRIGEGGSSAQASELARSSAPAIVDTSPVVVSRAEIEPGTPIETGMVDLRDWPSELVPDDALGSTDEMFTASGEPKLTQTFIFPGEPILAAKLDESPPRRKLSQNIDEGLRAVSIAVTNETGVSGFVLPGDWVDVLAYEQVPGARDYKAYRATPLVRRIEVLAADHVFGDDVEGALPSSLVTLAVTFDQARQITAAARQSRLGLALIGMDEIEAMARDERIQPAATPSPAPTVKRQTVSQPRVRPPARPKSTTVKVVLGTSVSSVTAPTSPAQSEPLEVRP